MKILKKTAVVSLLAGVFHLLIVACEEVAPLIDFTFEHKDLDFTIDSTLNSGSGEFLFLDTTIETNIDSLIESQDGDKDDIKEIRADSLGLEIIDAEINFDFLKSARITISSADKPNDVIQLTSNDFIIPRNQLRSITIPTRDEDLIRLLSNSDDEDEFVIRIYITRREGAEINKVVNLRAYFRAVAKVSIL